MIDTDRLKQELGDGEIAGCLKGDCPNPCCCTRKIVDITLQVREYSVFLYGLGELESLQNTHGSFEDLGIKKQMMALPKQGERPGEVIPSWQVAIKNCFEKEPFKCKLESAKPLECRVFPFMLNDEFAINPFCPNAPEIFAQQTNIRKMIRLRVLMELTYHEKWLETGRTVIRECFNKEPQKHHLPPETFAM